MKINPFEDFTLRDLISENGTTFNVGEEFTNMEEEMMYDPGVNLTDDELLKMINMQEFLDDDDEVEADCDIPLSIGIHFDKIKERMVDITPDGKVKKLVRQNGVGEIVPSDSLVTIKYSGYFDGHDEPYDSSHARGSPDRYQLGAGQLILGFELGIKGMKKHEVSIFWIHPDYAFGEFGCPPMIPPGAEIMYIVSLIDYLDNGTVNNFENLSIEEKKKFSNVKHNAANLFNIAADGFKQHKYKQAIRDYKKIVHDLEEAALDNEEEQQEMQKLLSKASQNLAICYNKENLPRQACIACNEAPFKNAKIHFHYGRALIKMGEYKQAITQLEKCLKIEPGNATAIKEMELANKFMKKYTKIEKEMWTKCLGISKTDSTKTGKYDDLAINLCKAFSEDEHIMRQPLPEGIQSEAEAAIRRQAAVMGLKVTSHKRFEKEIIYLSKPDYH